MHASVEEITAAAEARLAAERDRQLDAVRTLGRVAHDLEETRSMLTELERQHTAAWRDAENRGWTEQSLRDIGLTPPSKRPAGRPKKPRPTN